MKFCLEIIITICLISCMNLTQINLLKKPKIPTPEMIENSPKNTTENLNDSYLTKDSSPNITITNQSSVDYNNTLTMDDLNKKLHSDSLEATITKLNKFLYSTLKYRNQNIVIFNQTIILRNLTSETKIENRNGRPIGVHDFTKEPHWKQFLRSFVLNFFSEIGDKSFLCIVVFYNQVSPLFLFIMAVLAELLMNLISVVIGYEMTGSFSIRFFKLIGMWVFIFFGMMTFYEIFFAKEEEDKVKEESGEAQSVTISSIASNEASADEGMNVEETLAMYLQSGIKVFGMIFIAEFGDKSQITTIILTTECSPLWIFLGTAIAHIAGIIISIFIGYILSNKINLKMANVIGAVAFILMGLEMGVNYYRNPLDF